METQLLSGLPVSQAMQADQAALIEKLTAAGHQPSLALVRVGQRPDDLAYQRGLTAKAASWGIRTEVFEYDAASPTAPLVEAVQQISADSRYDGIMVFRPLPKTIDAGLVSAAVDPGKDVDGMTLTNMARLADNDGAAICPATAQAVVELLKYYQIPLAGRRIAVVGRSLVIGRPVSWLLVKENATVSVCHSHTSNLNEIISQSDIVIAALGRPHYFKDPAIFKPEAVIVDVGVNTDDSGAMCGDVDTAAFMGRVKAINPLLKGLGAVTTAVLLRQTVRCAVSHNR